MLLLLNSLLVCYIPLARSRVSRFCRRVWIDAPLRRLIGVLYRRPHAGDAARPAGRPKHGPKSRKVSTNTKNQDDIDYTETILKPMESLWASVRLPLLIPVLMLAYECRTAVLAAIGAVQSLFASPEAVVAEPAKRGLFALFGR